jgi:hypothetical protein
MTQRRSVSGILSLLGVAVLLIGWAMDSMWSASVDLAHHYALVARLSEYWHLPPGMDPSLGEMNFYPRAAHVLAAFAGSVFDSPLIGIQLVSLVSLIALWAATAFMLMSLPRTSAIWTSAAFVVLLVLNKLAVHAELYGDEIVGSFFFPQLVAQALVFVAMACVLRMEQRQVRPVVRYMVLSGSVVLITGVHLLPALELLGLFTLLIMLDVFAGHGASRRASMKTAGVGVALLIVTVAAVVLHPAFAAMKLISDHNGELLLAYISGLSGLVVMCAIVALVSTVLLMKWRKTSSSGDVRMDVLKYLAAYGIAVSGLCMLQIVALKLGHGSEYAVRKYIYSLDTVLLLEAALFLGLLFRGKKVPVDFDRDAVLDSRLVIPALTVVAFFSIAPPHRALDTSDVVSLERRIRLLRDTVIPKEPGKHDYAIGLPEMSPPMSYMFSIALLKAPRTENAIDVLRNKPMSRPYAIGTIVTSENFKPYDVVSCRRFVSSSGLVLLDGTCVARSLGRERTAFDFSEEETTAGCTFRGFGAAEPHGRWNDGKTASFACRLEAPDGKKFSRVWIDTMSFMYHGKTQRAAISVNGAKPVEFLYEMGKDKRIIELALAEPASGEVRIDFSFPDAISPKALGLSSDERKLAVSVKSIQFE